jgi:hypothetical protein
MNTKFHVLCALTVAAFLVAACSESPAPKSAAPSAAAPATADAKKEEASHGYEPGGLPGLADAMKGETKKDESKPDQVPVPLPAEPAKK